MGSDTPTLVKYAALAANSYFAWYWFNDLFLSKGTPDGKSLSGLGFATSDGPAYKKLINSVRKEQFDNLQSLRTGSKRSPISAKFSDLGPIKERVGVILGIIRDYSGINQKKMRNPEHAQKVAMLGELAREIVAAQCRPRNLSTGDAGSCIPEKDFEGELKALYNWYRAHVRYTRDPLYVDSFSAPDRTLKTGAGDCDDAAIVLGTLATHLGMPVRARVIATMPPGGLNGTDPASLPWSHIYLYVNPSAVSDGIGGPGKKNSWKALDATMPHGIGWEAPGAAKVALTGVPSGIVARVADFDL
jgi:hypothetical protein